MTSPRDIRNTLDAVSIIREQEWKIHRLEKLIKDIEGWLDKGKSELAALNGIHLLIEEYKKEIN